MASNDPIQIPFFILFFFTKLGNLDFFFLFYISVAWLFSQIILNYFCGQDSEHKVDWLYDIEQENLFIKKI